MRYLVLALLLITAVSAKDYTVYTPEGSFTTDAGATVTASFNLGSSADLAEKIAIYSSLQRIASEEESTQAQKDAATAARNETLEALTRAKADDAVILRIDGQSLILRHGECKSTETEVVCFKSIIYLEEDTPPLGDATLRNVKFEEGELKLPVVLSFTPFTSTVDAQRTLSKTTLYPGETASVTVRVRNTGNTPVTGVRITDEPPFETRGQLTTFKGGLQPNEPLLLEYSITAGEPGTYTIDGTFTPAFVTIPPTTVTVKKPLTFTSTISEGVANKPTPFSINLTNSYTSDITVSALVITTTDTFTIQSARGVRYEQQRITLDTTTIPAGQTITINGSVTATTPRTGTLSVAGRLKAARDDLIRETISYTIEEPGIKLAPTVTGSRVSLSLTNTDARTIEPISIDWGDGATTQVTYLAAGTGTTITHEYSGRASATITARYERNARATQRTSVVTLDGTGTAAPPTPQTPQETPQAPVPSETVLPEETPQEQQTPPAPLQQPKDDRGIIKKFLDWLDGLFK